MHIINKEFDKVVCINLKSRPDKKENMQNKFDKLGIEVEWFNAIQYGFAKEIVETLTNKNSITNFSRFNKAQPNEFGAAISHYTVIKTALEEGVKKLFVFEDDAIFRKDFNVQFEKYYNTLPENWDMFMLYSFMYNIVPQNIRVNSRWIKSYDSWSLLAYGMNRKMMEEYIKEQDKYFRIADLVSFELQRNENLHIYSAIPTLCIPNQKLGSNIRGDNMNYIKNATVLNFGFNDNNYE